MKLAYIIFILLSVFLFSQDFPTSWSQSYGTYDVANVHECRHYSLGFSLNNYCIYQQQGEHAGDTIAYDERRFDIFAKIRLLKNTEFEIKYSYPTSGILSLKYQFLNSCIDGALKCGFGYMKGTRVGKITDYVFDFYPTLIFSKNLFKEVSIFLAPKIIYSIHLKDRQEQSEREPRYIFQYGYGLGFSLGEKFSIMPETNWLFGNDEGKLYTVHQFGVGVNVRIH
jgi:hypothetical protein